MEGSGSWWSGVGDLVDRLKVIDAQFSKGRAGTGRMTEHRQQGANAVCTGCAGAVSTAIIRAMLTAGLACIGLAAVRQPDVMAVIDTGRRQKPGLRKRPTVSRLIACNNSRLRGSNAEHQCK